MDILSKRLDIFSEEEAEYVHESSLRLLEKVGMLIRDEDILNLLKKANCEVSFSNQVARVNPELVEDALKEAPHQVKLCGRNDKYDITLDGMAFYTRTVGGPPNIVDPETRRQRPATKQDIAPCARLTDFLDNIHGSSMFQVVPSIPLLDIYDAQISFNNTGKHLLYICHNIELIEPVIEIATIVAGGEDELKERPLISGLAESLSPLQFEEANAMNLKSFARRGLPLAIHSHPIAGASSPVTLVDEVVVLNAEILMLITIAELFEPGTPVIYGISASVPDMRTGLNLAGSVEVALLGCAGAQMARRYSLPSTMTAGTDSKANDAQASMERMLTTLSPVAAGINLINMSGIGSKLAFSPGQLVIDNEMSGLIARFMRGIKAEETIPVVELMREVGFKGNFFGHKHTAEHFREELLESKLLSREAWADWENAGSKTLGDRAWDQAIKIMREHKPEPLDKNIQDGIDKVIKSVGQRAQ